MGMENGKGNGNKLNINSQEIELNGTGSGKSNGFGGKRGVYVLGQLQLDPNVDLFIDKGLRKKPLIRKKGRFTSIGNLQEEKDELNC